MTPPNPTTTASPSILDEHRSSPGLLLALLGHEAMQRLRAAHTAHGLKPRQFQILGLLHDHGGLAQRELMQTKDGDPSIPGTLLDPLQAHRPGARGGRELRQPGEGPPTPLGPLQPPPEAGGRAARGRPPADRRRHLVTLTRAGERHLAGASRAQKETEDTLFASLDADQREQLRALLASLRDGLAADPQSDPTIRETGG